MVDNDDDDDMQTIYTFFKTTPISSQCNMPDKYSLIQRTYSVHRQIWTDYFQDRFNEVIHPVSEKTAIRNVDVATQIHIKSNFVRFDFTERNVWQSEPGPISIPYLTVNTRRTTKISHGYGNRLDIKYSEARRNPFAFGESIKRIQTGREVESVMDGETRRLFRFVCSIGTFRSQREPRIEQIAGFKVMSNTSVNHKSESNCEIVHFRLIL